MWVMEGEAETCLDGMLPVVGSRLKAETGSAVLGDGEPTSPDNWSFSHVILFQGVLNGHK